MKTFHHRDELVGKHLGQDTRVEEERPVNLPPSTSVVA